MSYPFFHCVVCHHKVQQVVDIRRGYLPAISLINKDVRFSSLFDDKTLFELHCRGQGPLYNHPHPSPFGAGDARADEILHYNFSGFFSGLCCFCARYSGFGENLFMHNGCSNCVRKDILRSGFARLFTKHDETEDASWGSHGWRALPVALVDHILTFVTGIQHAGQRVTICDGAVVMRLDHRALQ